MLEEKSITGDLPPELDYNFSKSLSERVNSRWFKLCFYDPHDAGIYAEISRALKFSRSFEGISVFDAAKILKSHTDYEVI